MHRILPDHPAPQFLWLTEAFDRTGICQRRPGRDTSRLGHRDLDDHFNCFEIDKYSFWCKSNAPMAKKPPLPHDDSDSGWTRNGRASRRCQAHKHSKQGNESILILLIYSYFLIIRFWGADFIAVPPARALVTWCGRRWQWQLVVQLRVRGMFCSSLTSNTIHIHE
jgi:hypothetical protein